jgi:hypothetical protein
MEETKQAWEGSTAFERWRHMRTPYLKASGSSHDFKLAVARPSYSAGGAVIIGDIYPREESRSSIVARIRPTMDSIIRFAVFCCVGIVGVVIADEVPTWPLVLILGAAIAIELRMYLSNRQLLIRLFEERTQSISNEEMSA